MTIFTEFIWIRLNIVVYLGMVRNKFLAGLFTHNVNYASRIRNIIPVMLNS